MDTLKKRRKIIKGKITRILNYCDNPEASELGIKSRCEKLDQFFKEFEGVQDEIEIEVDDQELDEEIAYRAAIEELYFEIKGRSLHVQGNDRVDRTIVEGEQNDQIRLAIDNLVQNQSMLGSIVERINTTTSPPIENLVEALTQQSSVQLPRINLPIFDGTFSEWIRFRDLFESLIHNKSNISKIEKFEYLHSHLRGEALSIVKHLTPSNDNYEIGWKLIKNKFDNLEALKKNYLRLLFDQSYMKDAVASELKRLINNTTESINALQAIGEPVSSWDSILIFHLEKKLDHESQTLWCRSAVSKPTTKKFLEFLDLRLKELENCQTFKRQSLSQANNQSQRTNIHTMSIKQCPLCQKPHYLFYCNEFKAMNVRDRINLVKKKRLCFNCFQTEHTATSCARSTCRICQAKHNTLLHLGDGENSMSNPQKSPLLKAVEPTAINSVALNKVGEITVLPTAIIMLLGSDNKYLPFRALLDTGAQATLISESCVNRLNLKRQFDNTMLCGIGKNSRTYSKGKLEITVKSRLNNHTIAAVALCVTKLTLQQPICPLLGNELEYFQNLQFADPSCTIPGHIDIILGADVVSKCKLGQQLEHPSGVVCALSTIFGWVIMGTMYSKQVNTITVSHVSIDLNEQLQRFWALEELQQTKQHLTDEEREAEEHYKKNVSRDQTGRYVVKLPFKQTFNNLESNRQQAVKRLCNLESKLIKNPTLRTEYVAFLNEYLELGHMEKSNETRVQQFYLPHHSVIKAQSSTTKVRVVFDGSAKCANGTSLNDQLLVGPTIQPDIFTIILQFRKYHIAVSADIEKMYRQILIHPDDRSYQCILWRENINEQIDTYKLNTVTYGTSAAPFLATRTLYQIAIENSTKYPLVSKAILNHFYVDDFMSSIPNVKEALELKTDLLKVLSQAGFHLRKWSSNCDEFTKTINSDSLETSLTPVIDDTRTVKTLGLFWSTKLDVFMYSVNLPDNIDRITKRHVLSVISKVFDPLGWLSPVVITLKIFMQRLWLSGIDWDSSMPDHISQQWITIQQHMQGIKKIQVPRWLQFANQSCVELHGFADASEQAYAAVIYLKVVDNEGKIKTNIITAKTRVAPVKQITLPRLELCACHLLSKLLVKVKTKLGFENVETFCWTDSTIVLAWLSDHPKRWKNFVANRTSCIIESFPAHHWKHISSKQNPADLATRGITSAELRTSELWWQGPTILQQDKSTVQLMNTTYATQIEKRVINSLLVVKDVHQNKIFFKNYSNYIKLLRVTALILRFAKNCKEKIRSKNSLLSTMELKEAHARLVLQAQLESFNAEFKLLNNKQQLPSNHKLIGLSPFVDDKQLLRVGGRLVNAQIPYDQKHPLILDKDSWFTELIIRYYHLKYLHAGTRQLQYILGLKYWIPSVMHVIKRIVYKCTVCLRYRNKPFQQQMGPLPKHRIEACTIFQNVGVDFAGPLLLRSWKGRGSKQYKCWIALFVCLSTKAIHLELVTELTTQAFIASLRRFVSRRGKPNNIYSDNGTNFIGCSHRLKELFQFMIQTETQEAINNESLQSNIQWHFSPPAGPNFGGLWEAGVKSVKYHLYRILGNAIVTYEEMTTILCQIESILNSRPLSARFEGDTDPLTPAHFLIMRSMHSVPDQNYVDTNINRLTRWQYLQHLVQVFWKRWQNEYLTQLQNRPKWKVKLENLKLNDIVLLKNEQSPPNKWLLGKVIKLHTGQDGLVRVVTIKTQTGEYKRPVSKLCPLLIDTS